MTVHARLTAALRLGSRPNRLQPVDIPLGTTVYAIGDVHGCADLLRDLEQRVLEDAATRPGNHLLVLLGDFIDRGPASAAVLDHIVFEKQPLPRICLAGNHEAMMRDFLRAPHAGHEWLRFGGQETLLSYGLDPHSIDGRSGRKLAQSLAAHVPAEHRAFLDALPLVAQSDSHVFVHAGLRPDLPLESQCEQDLLWGKPDATAPRPDARIIVHGHTPVAAPAISNAAICIDTGAYRTGCLTAVRLVPGEPPAFFLTGKGARQ